jgi:peptidoglycan/LPS O-acetylase OafA/YrhL
MYRKDIDGMRAIAVLAVIVNHFTSSVLPCGYVGVDIFFAISGFVITASLVGRGESTLGEFILASIHAGSGDFGPGSCCACW